jgi:NADH-quinone oxidoreductase subunit D
MFNGSADYRSNRKHLNNFLLNFGPQHPAAHGILKISLSMSGEIIQRADLQFGLLHRGSEKLCEARSYSQVVPYMDRMDYVANLFQEHAAVASIESLEPTKAPTSFILALRLVLDELSRVLNHLLTMSAICLDLGAMGPIF